jgi:hypothetical protein
MLGGDCSFYGGCACREIHVGQAPQVTAFDMMRRRTMPLLGAPHDQTMTEVLWREQTAPTR